MRSKHDGATGEGMPERTGRSAGFYGEETSRAYGRRI